MQELDEIRALNRIATLESKVEALTKQVQKLQGITVTGDLRQKTSIGNCLGFSLCRDRKGRYSGVRRFNGKLVSVYIGKDLSLARQKLDNWLDKH